LRRYAPVALVSVFSMVSRMLLKRLLMGDFGRVKAVYQGFRGA